MKETDPKAAERRRELRRQGIAARGAIPKEERENLSALAAERLAQSELFQRAETVLVYAHTKAELSLEALENHPLAAGKRLVYPLCVGPGEMIVLFPQGEDAWREGLYGIREPVRERSLPVSPEEIDLVVCPCSAFDEACRRMGMGAGYYDRYLPLCVNARICAVAFEAQKLPEVPAEEWDVPMEAVFTERTVYIRKAAEKG